MNRVREFGWSPEQLARVNARREMGGKDPYLDVKMGDPDYMSRYQEELSKFLQRYGANQRSDAKVAPESLESRQELSKNEFQERFTPKKSMRELAEERTNDFQERFTPRKSMRELAEERTSEFQKRFAPTGSMRINANVRSQAGNLKNKKNKKNNEDVYDSSISQSMIRMLS